MRYKSKSLKFFIIIFVMVMAFIFLLNYLGIGTLGSAIRIGYVSHDGFSNWSASYTLFDGWLQHTIRPKTDTLHVEVKTESGTISIEMKDKDGNIFFSESNIETQSFEVAVSGKVVIKIKADHHKGGFNISSDSSTAVQTGQINEYTVDMIKVGDKEYTASYFGKMDLSGVFPDYQYREFWRLENAYDDHRADGNTWQGTLVTEEFILTLENN